MFKRSSVTLILLTMVFAATATAPRPTSTATLGTKVLTGAAIGYVVKQSAGGLNKFINTITLNRKVPNTLSTKVVPILSVGEKAYVGGAQVSGPAVAVNNVKAVWQYEDNFANNRFRLKVLVPSNSLNPIKISRVSKVGVSALIDISLAGGWDYDTASRGITAGDVILAAGVAVAVKNLAPSMNKAINTISFNKGLSTRVVPMATFGEKAYIGAGQVSGSASSTNAVNAVYQYEDFFSSGRFRVKVLVPTTSSNPLKMKRVSGAGVTAVVDMSLARQRELWNKNQDRYLLTRYNTRQSIEDRYRYRRDQGLHKGWWQGRHEGWYKNGKAVRPVEVIKVPTPVVAPVPVVKVRGLDERDRHVSDQGRDRDKDSDKDKDKGKSKHKGRSHGR